MHKSIEDLALQQKIWDHGNSILKHVHHSLTIDMKVVLMLSGRASVLSNGVQTFQTNTSVRRAWRDGEENSSSGSTIHSSSSERQYR